MQTQRLSLTEMFGLSPLPQRLREVALVLRGDPFTPASRFDLTSLRVLQPGLSLKTWLGRRRSDRMVPIYNLFNHTQTPIEDGWSVRQTQARDFQGGQRTYDSHNGTDFAVPVGTVVVAAAPGIVLRVSSEFHRGGLKVLIDHGAGVVTTSNHLGRALVAPGDRVERAQPVALSGASGVDMVAAFPWNAPHVHYNVWLDGVSVDPFAREGEVALWRGGNAPRPHKGPADRAFEPTKWDQDAVADAIDACLDPALRSRLAVEADDGRRAADVLFHLNYFPTRFSRRPALYADTHTRQPLLDLPFRAADFVGIAL